MFHWLLKFGTTSRKLREVVAEVRKWLANKMPPWAAYRALMAGRLHKCLESEPIGAGEIRHRLFAKCVFQVTGGAAKEVCGTDQLCAGLEAGIEGGMP